MAKKRTKAQRSAAAKAAWQLRKLQAANTPSLSTEPWKALEAATAEKLPTVDFSVQPATYGQPATAVATHEGEDYYVTVSIGGSLFRHKLSRAALRSLGLDCIKLAG